MLKLHKIGPNSYKQLIFTMHGLDPSFKCKLLEYKDFQMVTQISISPNEIHQGWEERGSSFKAWIEQKEEEEGEAGHRRGALLTIFVMFSNTTTTIIPFCNTSSDSKFSFSLHPR